MYKTKGTLTSVITVIRKMVMDCSYREEVLYQTYPGGLQYTTFQLGVIPSQLSTPEFLH